ncbi:MAG: hypothetical protein V5A81_07745 [Candidatus Bipolaricaulota bacterium]
MQLSIHYKEKDKYLIEKLEKLAERRRMSKSACILSILEDYLESDNLVGQILKDMNLLDKEQLQQALLKQRKAEDHKKIGQIMVNLDYVNEDQLNRALEVQEARQN